MSDAERKRKEREGKRDAGLVPMEIWTFESLKHRIRKYIQKLNRENVK